MPFLVVLLAAFFNPSYFRNSRKVSRYIMKQIGEVGRTIFRDVAAVIFDEADRMALNMEMSKQIYG